MDNKKPFASLMEDHSPGPGSGAVGLRPPSPVQNGARRLGARNRDGGSGGSGGSGADTCAAAPSSHTSDLDGLDLALALDQPAPSCVTKETPQEDCARHRFIVWAAVKRNSSVRMTVQERLECPLLRCTKRFGDHESMLKHLAGCRYLASGEYWCYDHMRVERFDDLKCKRCLGHPSKRRKIVYLAKNFFNSLGHKSKKAPGLGFDDDEVLLAPPPSYDSLDIPAANANASELLSTEILEIDSMEVPLLQPTPIPAPSDVIDPQALRMPTVPELPELDSTTLSNEAFLAWQPVSGITPPSFLTPQENPNLRPSAVKPALQLATAGLQGRHQAPRPVPIVPRSKGLSPSSSVRSTASTETNASMMSNGSSMISPSSNWSGAWSMGSGLNTSMTSPVDGVAADDMFADAMNSYQNDACPDFLHNRYSELPADLPMLENAADMSVLDNATDMASDGYLGYDAPRPAANLSYAPELELPDEPVKAIEMGEPEVERTNTCCSETKSLVSSAWDTLQEHIVTSMGKLHDLKTNHLANKLRSMSIGTIATTGLRTLRNLINGQEPCSASDALCMIHLINALTFTLHEQGTSARVKSLFLQSLAYSDGLSPDDRIFYRQLVVTIWQPPDVTQPDTINLPASNGKGKAPEAAIPASEQRTDSLLSAARDYLDELEVSLLRQGDLPFDMQISDLYTMHLKEMSQVGSANKALLEAATHAFELLSQSFLDACLDNMLGGIYQQINNGCICSVRRLEIEILRAGKYCLPAGRFFGQFVPRTRVVCDRLYEDHDVGATRRHVYHGLGVALIESLIPEFDNPPARPVVEPLDDIEAFLHDFRFDAGSAAATSAVDLDLQMPGTPAFDFGSAEAQLSIPLQLSTPPQLSMPLSAMNGTQSGSTAVTSTDNLQMAGSQAFDFGSTQAQLLTPQLSTPLATMNGTQSGSVTFTSVADLQMAGLQAFDFGSAQAQLPTPPRFSTPPQFSTPLVATNGTPSGSVAITSTGDLPMTGSQMFNFGLAQAQLPTPPQFSTPLAATNGTPSGNAAIASTNDLQMTGSQVFHFGPAQAQLSAPLEATRGARSGSARATTPAGKHAKKQPAARKVSGKRPAPEADDDSNPFSSCDTCGYRPKGDPQWFKGSMAKHRRLQHGTGPPAVYKCPFPGCKSQYKNRPDNLRQHQLEKNHWVEGDEIAPRRPGKRRKASKKQ